MMHEDDEDEIFYDSKGNVSPSGFYDAGGHLIAERWAEQADDLRDRMKDENL